MRAASVKMIYIQAESVADFKFAGMATFVPVIVVIAFFAAATAAAAFVTAVFLIISIIATHLCAQPFN